MTSRIRQVIAFMQTCGLPAVLPLGMFAVICLPFLQDEVYASYDFFEMAIPDRIFYAWCLKTGDSGHWIPFFWRGLDHVGYGETGMFHPIRQMYRLLPLVRALQLEMVMHFPISLAGAWVYLRRRHGLDPSSALFGASLFAFSIFPLAHFGQMHMCLIFSHLPWMAFFAWKALTGRRPWPAAAGTGLCLGSMLLLCHPQTAFIVCIPVGLVIVIEVLRQRDGRVARRAGILAAALPAGLLVGMLQLLPTLTALQEAARGRLTQAERCSFSLHPLHLAPNLLPRLYGHYGLGDWVTPFGESKVFLLNSSEFTAYFGIGVLSFLWGYLVLGGIDWRRRRVEVVACGLVVVVIVLLMLGSYGGLHRLLIHVPLIADFRSPNRYKAVLSTLLAVGAALAMYRLRSLEPKELPRRRRLLLFVPGLLCLGAGLIAWRVGNFRFHEHLVVAYVASSLIWGVGVAGGVGLLLYLWQTRRRQWLLTLIAGICVTDLAAVGLEILLKQPRMPVSAVRRAEARLRPGPRRRRVIAPSNFPLWDGEYMATGYLGMRPSALIPYTHTRFLQLASVGRGYKTPNDSREVPEPVFPRFRLVANLRRQDGPVDWENLPDPGTGALTTIDRELQGPPPAPEEGVRILEEGYSRITLEVTARVERLLVCSDRWAPGWTAVADGRDLPVLPLYDAAMRGVIVPPGTHRVVMQYSSPAVRRGRFWCWLGLAVLGLLALVQVFDRRRQDGAQHAPASQESPRPE